MGEGGPKYINIYIYIFFFWKGGFKTALFNNLEEKKDCILFQTCVIAGQKSPRHSELVVFWEGPKPHVLTISERRRKNAPFFEIVSSQADIRNTFFNKKSP